MFKQTYTILKKIILFKIMSVIYASIICSNICTNTLLNVKYFLNINS